MYFKGRNYIKVKYFVNYLKEIMLIRNCNELSF